MKKIESLLAQANEALSELFGLFCETYSEGDETPVLRFGVEWFIEDDEFTFRYSEDEVHNFELVESVPSKCGEYVLVYCEDEGYRHTFIVKLSERNEW